jgi:serine protease Do
MRRTTLKQCNKTPHYLVISTILIISLFLMPLSTSAEDNNSIATLRQIGKAFASIAEKASPAVVGLKADRVITREYSSLREWPFGEPFDPFNDDIFERFFRFRSPGERTPQRKYRETRPVQGSGFIISADGYVLTSNHLVEDAEKVEVELSDDRKFTAEIKGTDPETDLALIKIDAENLPYLELADSDKLEVGEWVLAIGNPFGLRRTVTEGIVSATGRSGLGLTTYEDFIQTTAAINFGNSGGPLINLDGEVVGINSAIVGSTGNIGIGFAVPINMAKAILPQLKKGEEIERGFLGVDIQDLTPELAEYFGLKNTKGVLIPEVHEGSAAEKAGLKPNDIIVEFNGKTVDSAKELQSCVAMLEPGTSVKIVVLRDGKKETLAAELAKRPPLSELTGNLPKDVQENLGFSVQDLTDELAQRYDFKGQSGVVVTDVKPGSDAARAGIVQGTLIKEVNGQPISNTREFNEELKKASKKGRVLLKVKRERYTFFVLLQLKD